MLKLKKYSSAPFKTQKLDKLQLFFKFNYTYAFLSLNYEVHKKGYEKNI